MDSKTIMGDQIPTAGDWILLLAGRIQSSDIEFKDVISWEVRENMEAPVVIDVVYRSGREETYSFSHECVASGMMLIDPRDEIMNAWDGEREQPVI